MDVYPDPKEIRKPIQIEQISGPERKPHDILEFESMLRYEDRQIFGEFGLKRRVRYLLQEHLGVLM